MLAGGSAVNGAVPNPSDLFTDAVRQRARTRAEGRRLYLVSPQSVQDSKNFYNSRIDSGYRKNFVYDAFKRSMDLCVALAMIVLLAPVMVFIAGCVFLTSGGPVIYRQRRLTMGGKVFTILKFRTMKVGAEKLTGPVFASENDPRITKLGRFMRKTRLDELPQLFNVLSGSMSLVGPRPERPELAVQLENSIPRFHQRLQTKAGLTGLAQVRQGYPDGVDGYRRKLALDLLYIKKQSVALDLWIAVRTVGVVISGSGAR